MIVLETGVEVPEEVRGISISLAASAEGAPLTFVVGGLTVRPRYRHNYGAGYSLEQAISDRERAIIEGDVDPDTPVPEGGSTACYLEESTVRGYAVWAVGAVLCGRADQYSRPSGRARSLKRALIQLARHIARRTREPGGLDPISV